MYPVWVAQSLAAKEVPAECVDECERVAAQADVSEARGAGSTSRGWRVPVHSQSAHEWSSTITWNSSSLSKAGWLHIII